MQVDTGETREQTGAHLQSSVPGVHKFYVGLFSLRGFYFIFFVKWVSDSSETKTED
jgi:hypothetical protein